MRLTYDIETNMCSKDTWDKKVFLNNVVSLACICIQDMDSGEQFIYHDNPDLGRTGTNEEGVLKLLEAKLLVAHNGKGFDLPALQALYPEHSEALAKVRQFDTLSASRDIFDWKFLKEYDKKNNVQHNEYNAKSLHSLGAYGDRFAAKGKVEAMKDEEFKATVDWTNIQINQDLINYCMQDVVVNIHVFDTLVKAKQQMRNS